MKKEEAAVIRAAKRFEETWITILGEGQNYRAADELVSAVWKLRKVEKRGLRPKAK